MGEVINFDDMPDDERRVALTEIFGSTGWGAEAVAVGMGESAGDLVPVDPDEPIPLPFEQASSRSRTEFKFIQDPATGKLMGSEPEAPAPDPGDYPDGEDDEDYQAAWDAWHWDNPLDGTKYSGELEEDDMFKDEVLPDLRQQVLNSKQWEVVKDYQNTELHREVNGALRKGGKIPDRIADEIVVLDSTMTPAATDFTAFRGISDKAVTALVGKGGFEVGQTFKDGSFQSTTTNPNAKLTPFMTASGTKHPTLLEIDVPQGHDILNVSGSGPGGQIQSANPNDPEFTRIAEREVILGRDTEYTVTGVYLLNDRNHGVVQVVQVTASQTATRAAVVEEPTGGESKPAAIEDNWEPTGYLMSRDESLTALYDGETDLDNADFSYEWLEGADLFGASLRGADLTETNLEDAALDRANLTSANLTGANLARAGLTDANLSGADLTGADLTDTVLDGVISDDKTVWPRGFTPPSSKPVKASGRKSPAKKAPAKKASAKKASAKKAPAKRKAT